MRTTSLFAIAPFISKSHPQYVPMLSYLNKNHQVVNWHATPSLIFQLLDITAEVMSMLLFNSWEQAIGNLMCIWNSYFIICLNLRKLFSLSQGPYQSVFHQNMPIPFNPVEE